MDNLKIYFKFINHGIIYDIHLYRVIVNIVCHSDFFFYTHLYILEENIIEHIIRRLEFQIEVKLLN